jgi:fido (protein-threonine AMPylation protein)
MESLLAGANEWEPAEWFRRYEEVHPFVDGNGRTGQVLLNWLDPRCAHMGTELLG